RAYVLTLQVFTHWHARTPGWTCMMHVNEYLRACVATHSLVYVSTYLRYYLSMKVITVTNLKGGSAKTTSTAYLAHAYAAEGKSVLIIDADPQGSALRWSEQGEWDIPTIALPVKNLHTRIRGIVSPDTD